jgi:6-pyruvoyltetrahydropterin/6-carboxytetrahydropterin synthase
MWIGKEFHFDAAHSLPQHEHCGKVHGHTYTVRIEFKGEPVPPYGFVMDFDNMKKVVNPVLDQLDHDNLNDVLPLLIPSCENLSVWICQQVKGLLIKNFAVRPEKIAVTVQEGGGGFARHQEDIDPEAKRDPYSE